MSAALLDRPSEAAIVQVAVLVAPANGVPVLRDVFRSLQGDFRGVVVILLHTGVGRERSIANNLNVAPNFMVLPAQDGMSMRNGHAYVVRADSGLVLGDDGTLIDGVKAKEGDAMLFGNGKPRLSNSAAPIQALLASLADRYGAGAVAVALTALDPSESDGFRRVRTAGGYTISLDEADRLWADSSGPRVVPDVADELLSTSAIGPRMLALPYPS